MGQPLRLYLPANAFTSRHAPLYETHDAGLLSQCSPKKSCSTEVVVWAPQHEAREDEAEQAGCGKAECICGAGAGCAGEGAGSGEEEREERGREGEWDAR
jgi:hypothetical protein